MHLFFLGILSLLVVGADGAIVACLGDSITEGRGIPYPTLLGNDLVDDVVLNFGKGGRRAQSDKGNSYRATDEYAEALDSGADYFVLTLGTNDAVLDTWDEDAYRAAMIEIVESLPGIVFVCAPPPFIEFKDNLGDPETSPINTVMPSIVEDVAQVTGSNFVNFYQAFGGLENVDSSLYRDSVHPNTQGNQILSDTVLAALPLTRRPTLRPTTRSPSFAPTLAPTTPPPSFSPSKAPTTRSPSSSPSHFPTGRPTAPRSEPTTIAGGSSSSKKKNRFVVTETTVLLGIVGILAILVLIVLCCLGRLMLLSRSRRREEKVEVFVRQAPPPSKKVARAATSPRSSDGGDSICDMDLMEPPPL